MGIGLLCTFVLQVNTSQDPYCKNLMIQCGGVFLASLVVLGSLWSFCCFCVNLVVVRVGGTVKLFASSAPSYGSDDH